MTGVPEPKITCGHFPPSSSQTSVDRVRRGRSKALTPRPRIREHNEHFTLERQTRLLQDLLDATQEL